MSYSKYKTEKVNGNLIIDFLKGLIVAILISFALIIVLACCLKWFSIDEKFIIPLNIAIKILSVIFGAMIAIRGDKAGLLKGVVFGCLYMFLAFTTFSFLAKSYSVDLGLLLDVICTCIAGGIVGVVKVNARN